MIFPRSLRNKDLDVKYLFVNELAGGGNNDLVKYLFINNLQARIRTDFFEKSRIVGNIFIVH